MHFFLWSFNQSDYMTHPSFPIRKRRIEIKSLLNLYPKKYGSDLFLRLKFYLLCFDLHHLHRLTTTVRPLLVKLSIIKHSARHQSCLDKHQIAILFYFNQNVEFVIFQKLRAPTTGLYRLSFIFAVHLAWMNKQKPPVQELVYLVVGSDDQKLYNCPWTTPRYYLLFSTDIARHVTLEICVARFHL